MNNCLIVEGKKIELTPELARKLAEDISIPQVKLCECEVGSTVKIGKFEMVVLEQQEGKTALILKDMYGEETEFSKDNNCFSGSYADEKCQAFAEELGKIVGAENISEHTVDLTSNDGLDDYGTVKRRASLLTADLYRKFVKILDTCNPERWWWLATPFSTKRHESDRWALCVSPAGGIYGSVYNSRGRGVRPFCILKSTIFVSK